MPLDEVRIDDLKETLRSALKPAMAAAGLAEPAAAAILLGMRMIFRFVKLGTRIRAALEEARMSLDQEIRAEGIVRISPSVSVKYTQVMKFFQDNLNRNLYSPAFEQLDPEIRILTDPDHPDWQEAFEVLFLAYKKLAEIKRGLKFDDPLLDDLYGKWMDPDHPDYRSLFREMRMLCGEPYFSLPRLKKILPDYIRLELEMKGARLDQITDQQLDILQKQLGVWIWETIMGPEGAVRDTLDFTIQQVMIHLDGEIEKLEARKKAIQNHAGESLSDTDRKALEKINLRIEALRFRKGRIQSAA